MDILQNLSPTLLYTVIGLFLLLNLIVGLWQGRHVKTLRSYALADRSMGTGTLAITVIATVIGSKYLTASLLSAQHKGILAATLSGFIFPVLICAFGYFIFPKLLHFQDCYTLGDIMGKLYGRHAQIFTGFLSLLASITFIVAQLIGVGNICQGFHLSSHWVIIILGFIIILYTWIGGIRSVAATDVLQFLCVVAGFIFIVYRIFQLDDGEGGNIGSLQHLTDLIQKKYGTKYLTVFKHKRFWNISTGSFLLSLVLFSPPIINRILVARNVSQMRKSLYSFAAFYPLLRLSLTIIGFSLLLKHGTNRIQENTGFVKIAEYFFVGNPWVIILLLIMLIAIAMSTADSFLNSLVVVVIRDIIQPIKQEKDDNKNVMRYIPYIAVLVGGAAIGLSLISQKQYVTDLTTLSMRLFGVFLVPILLYSLGFKSNKKVFWVSVISFFLIAGFLTYLGHINYLIIGDPLLWKGYILRRKMQVIVLITLLVVLVISIIAHIIIHRGLAFTPHPTLKDQEGSNELGSRDKQEDGESKFRDFFKRPLQWASEKMRYIGDMPVIFGIGLSLSWMLPELTTPQPHPKNLPIFFWTRIIGLAICAGLMLQNRWKPSIRRYFPLFYFFALVYCLPFNYTLTFLYNPNNSLNSNLLGLGLILLIVLVDRTSFYFFTAIGMTMAFIVAYLSPVHIPIATPALWQIGVNLLIVFVVSIAFGYFKEGILKQRLKTLNVWINGYDHDMRNQLGIPFGNLQGIKMFLTKNGKEVTKDGEEYYSLLVKKKDYNSFLLEGVDQSLQGIRSILQQSQAIMALIKAGHMSKSSMEKTSLMAAAEKAFTMMPASYRELLDIRLERKNDFEAVIHPVLFANVIANLIKNADKHGEAREIILGCDPERREFYVKDNGKGIPPHIEPYIFNLYFSTSSTGIGLPFVQRLVETMGGTIRFTTSAAGTTFFIHLPERKIK